MRARTRRPLTTLGAGATAVLAVAATAAGSPAVAEPPSSTFLQVARTIAQQRAATAYWTPERMRSAAPVDAPAYTAAAGGADGTADGTAGLASTGAGTTPATRSGLLPPADLVERVRRAGAAGLLGQRGAQVPGRCVAGDGDHLHPVAHRLPGECGHVRTTGGQRDHLEACGTGLHDVEGLGADGAGAAEQHDAPGRRAVRGGRGAGRRRGGAHRIILARPRPGRGTGGVPCVGDEVEEPVGPRGDRAGDHGGTGVTEGCRS